jgi:UDP-glucose 4-epimerase
MTERALGRYCRCLGLRSVSLRYFNAAGAWSHGSVRGLDRQEQLGPVAHQCALGRRGPIVAFRTEYPTPDGTAIRDYVNVLDLANAHVRALEYLEGGERPRC